MRSLSALVWRNLTAHPLRSILTALAITLGVGMVLAAAIVGQAASQSASELSDEGPQVDLEILARDGGTFDQAILDELRAFSEVDRVLPSLRIEVEGVRPAISRLTLLGVYPQAYQALHEPRLAGGTFLDGPDTIVLPMAIALDNNLHVGDEMTLRSEDRIVTLVVAGRLAMEQDAVLPYGGQSLTAFVPLGVAQTLGVDWQGQIDRVEVVLRPDVDVEQVRADLARVVGPDLAVVRAAAGGVMGNVVLVQAGLAVVGLIILFAAGFVILNAFAMSITGRMREIGALRALGMTRRQVVYAVLAEAGLLGLTGTVAGVLVGLGLAWAVMHVMGTLEEMPLVMPWWGLLLSVLMGLTVTLVAVLQPAWRASRVSPIVAARPEAATTTGWYVRSGGRVGAVLLGLLMPGLVAYGLLVRPSVFTALAVSVVGQAALLGAAVLLLPALVDPVTALCRPLLVRWLGTAGRLAADNLGRNKLRAVLTAGALTAGLTIIVATSGLMTAGLKGAVSRVRLSTGYEDGFVTADLAEVVASQEMTVDNFFQFLTQDDPGFDLNPVIEALGPLVESGVIEVIRYRFQAVPSELSALPGAPGLMADPDIYLRLGNFEFFEGNPETALEWMQRGRAMLLVPIVAERLGAGVGDDIPVQTPHGEVAFTVAGIGGGGLLMTVFPYADGEAYFDATKPSFLGIAVTEGQDVETALARVEEAIEPFPGIKLHDYDESLDPVLEMVDRLGLLLNALLLLAVVVAALGVVNTMVINVAERRREIGLLRAVGATQRQVRRSVVAEAAMLGLLAALVASGLGLLMLLTWGILVLPGGTGSLGIRPDWETVRLTMGAGLRDWGLAAAVSLIFGPLVAGLAAYYPARQAAAMDVVEATRSERLALRRTGTRRPERTVKRFPRSLALALALRNLGQDRLRAILSALAVALGVAMIVAASVTSEGVRSGVRASEANLDATAWMTDLLEASLNAVGFVILLAAGFLVLNAFAMSITRRRRQIGALRSLGMTRGCKRGGVMWLVLVEAFITGGGGTLLGLAAGPLLGSGLLALMRSLGIEIGRGSVSLASVTLAMVMGMGVTLLSVLVPAWRATRISPLVALRQETTSGVERVPLGRAVLGVLIMAGLIVYLIIAPPGEWTLPPWEIRMSLLLALLWMVALLLVLPAIIGGLGRVARGGLARVWGAAGRLAADNLRRDRRRVTLTVLTLAVGLAMIVSVSGIVTFMFTVLFDHLTQSALQQRGLIVVPIDVSGGSAIMALEIDEFNLETLFLEPEVVEDVTQVAQGRAEVGAGYAVIAPEIGALVSNYPSFIYDLDVLTRPGFYTFAEGDWDSALPVMEAGCGLLISPGVAARNQVGVGDALTLQGVTRPINCTVAGLGAGGYHPASFISPAAREAFDVDEPAALIVFPLPDTDRDALEADLSALAERHGSKAGVMGSEVGANAFSESGDVMISLMNGLLLLAVLAAAMGVVNTTVMSVAERRHELGLLRAVGATRRQVVAVVAGEAALMGLVGGGLGLVAGAGISLIFALSFGGNGFGVVDLPLWDAAWQATQPAVLTGLLGLVTAPLISAGAAWLPSRSILRGAAVETMQPERQRPMSPRRAAVGLLGWGSIRVRFVLGTAILMVLVLAGLIGVVTAHERSYLADLMREALITMVEGQAGLIELILPDDAQRLSLSDLQVEQFGADDVLRFEAVVDDMSAYGLESFVVADHDNVVLLSLDPREVGTVLPELESPGESWVTSEREGEDRSSRSEWWMRAAAPIWNEEGQIVGSVRLTVNLARAQEWLGKTRYTLWVVGGGIVIAGLALSWMLATPLVVATGQLAAYAARVARGEYVLFDRPRRRRWSWLVARTSLRARLTAAMVLIIVALVGVLELAVIPIERYHTESKLKDNVASFTATAADWMGQAVSEGWGTEPWLDRLFDGSQDGLFSFDQVLDMAGVFDGDHSGRWAKLQELSEKTRSEDVAYVALVDREGVIQLSDQFSLIGESAPVPAKMQIEDARWRDEEVWVVSAPLRRGRGGEQIGMLQLGVRRTGVEEFLNESRSLFRLTGLIAVLAGVLLAQAIGGAVTAPVRQLAADTRRVGQGDLSVQFRINTQDELALLAAAFDHMVTGLREREWLRDMFGRFVSREVAEAIRTGQVRLEGENRVVSVLFCDIRGFTARSEQSTPEEMVALLNEYLPVVVEAARRHEGTVSKFGGDSTLVIYGAPRPLQESAYRAVLTALEMRVNLEQLNKKLAEQGEMPIRIGMGVNTGMVLAGAVGPKERQEYAVIGDAVNLASRIEALNKEYPHHDILLSGWTYEALGSRRAEFEFADLGKVAIQGKAEPVRVWAVVGFK